MQDGKVLHNGYLLCGFLNIHQLFPAFVYPVFCKGDEDGEIHYYFEDGKTDTIQQFYEIDLQTFPELIGTFPIPPVYSVGSDSIYAYAAGSNSEVVWGNIEEIIPALKLILSTVSDRVHHQRIIRFIFAHWKEWVSRQLHRSGPKLALRLTVAGMAIVLLLFAVSWYNGNVPSNSRMIDVISGNSQMNNSEGYSGSNGNNSIPDVVLLSDYIYIDATSDSPIIGNLAHTFPISSSDSSNDQEQQLLNLIAVDCQTGEQYNTQKLANRRLLIPYHEKEQDCFFYGSLNEEGNYDGRCIVNVYKDQKLQMITDSFYDNGKLLNCKQMFSYTTKRGASVWAFSSRKPGEGKFRSGETWTYLHKDIAQEFIYEEVTPENIISSDNFEELIEAIGAQKEGYYNGTTLNGSFEDITGKAYMVKYFKEDGTVRTLYVGQMKNGGRDDSTGKAWEIGKKKVEQEYYAYFEGEFSEDKEDDGRWKYNLEQATIDGILAGYTFQCPLPGLVKSETEATNI